MGHLSMIVFQKCVVMPRIFGGYWGGSVDPEVNKVGKEQFDHSSPITKSKLVCTQIISIVLENLSKTPPDEHPVSFSWTINTKGHTLSLHIREIHFFIIDSFCLYYVIHPFYTDTMVLSIYKCCAPSLFLLTTTWHQFNVAFPQPSTLFRNFQYSNLPFPHFWAK